MIIDPHKWWSLLIFDSKFSDCGFLLVCCGSEVQRLNNHNLYPMISLKPLTTMVYWVLEIGFLPRFKCQLLCQVAFHYARRHSKKSSLPIAIIPPRWCAVIQQLFSVSHLNSTEESIGYLFLGGISLSLHGYALFLCSAIFDYQDEKPDQEKS